LGLKVRIISARGKAKRRPGILDVENECALQGQVDHIFLIQLLKIKLPLQGAGCCLSVSNSRGVAAGLN